MRPALLLCSKLGINCVTEWAQSAMHSIGSEFGIVRNPYALDHTTGGSSGGPAAATAANLGEHL